MSVPEGKRTESKLRVQTQSRELARHTMQLCSNEKIFPKRDRWILSSRIMDTALEIMENVKRRRRKMRNQLRLVMGEKMTVPKFMESYKSWRAHASKGSSNQLLRRMDEYAVGLLEETYVQDTRVG